MPLTSIHLKKGNDKDFISSLMDATMNCVQNVLQLPDEDRNIRVMEYEPAYFQMKAPYQMTIEISMFKGRSKETKKKLLQSLVETLHDRLQIEKHSVFILINEQEMDNWGVRGGIPASELNLGFDVNI